MNCTCSLSANAQRYLAEYRTILSDMINAMESAGLTNSISGNFISRMLPHHRAAVEMSRNLLRYTTDLTLQRIAENIISTQTESIAALERVRRTCTRTVNARSSVAGYNSQVESIIDAMFARMESAPAGNNIDCDFIREMLPHHEGAIRMSRTALQYSLCPGLVPILNDIIKSQSTGVRELRELSGSLACR